MLRIYNGESEGRLLGESVIFWNLLSFKVLSILKDLYIAYKSLYGDQLVDLIIDCLRDVYQDNDHTIRREYVTAFVIHNYSLSILGACYW